jgi:hypothetical protein
MTYQKICLSPASRLQNSCVWVSIISWQQQSDILCDLPNIILLVETADGNDSPRNKTERYLLPSLSSQLQIEAVTIWFVAHIKVISIPRCDCHLLWFMLPGYSICKHCHLSLVSKCHIKMLVQWLVMGFMTRVLFPAGAEFIFFPCHSV